MQRTRRVCLKGFACERRQSTDLTPINNAGSGSEPLSYLCMRLKSACTGKTNYPDVSDHTNGVWPLGPCSFALWLILHGAQEGRLCCHLSWFELNRHTRRTFSALVSLLDPGVEGANRRKPEAQRLALIALSGEPR